MCVYNKVSGSDVCIIICLRIPSNGVNTEVDNTMNMVASVHCATSCILLDGHQPCGAVLWYIQYTDTQEVVVLSHVHTRTIVSLHGLYFQDTNSIPLLQTSIIHTT